MKITVTRDVSELTVDELLNAYDAAQDAQHTDERRCLRAEIITRCSKPAAVRLLQRRQFDWNPSQLYK